MNLPISTIPSNGGTDVGLAGHSLKITTGYLDEEEKISYSLFDQVAAA